MKTNYLEHRQMSMLPNEPNSIMFPEFNKMKEHTLSLESEVKRLQGELDKSREELKTVLIENADYFIKKQLSDSRIKELEAELELASDKIAVLEFLNQH